MLDKKKNAKKILGVAPLSSVMLNLCVKNKTTLTYKVDSHVKSWERVKGEPPEWLGCNITPWMIKTACKDLGIRIHDARNATNRKSQNLVSSWNWSVIQLSQYVKLQITGYVLTQALDCTLHLCRWVAPSRGIVQYCYVDRSKVPY